MKRLLKLSFLTAALLAGAISFAQSQPQGMIGGAFDLKSAILSPAPLGPPSQFEPPAAAAKPVANPTATTCGAPLVDGAW